MAKNFVKSGRVLSLIAPTGGVTTGVGVLLETVFAVALVTASAGVAFEGAVTGVWDLAKNSTDVWVVGDKIYWDNANKRCTNLPAAGFRYIGTASAAAANPSSTGN